LGAEWNNTPVGQFGYISTFSFYFSHHITTLEGGMVIANYDNVHDMLKILRAHGWVRDLDDSSAYTSKYPDIDPKFLFVNAGYNLRATELQAAIGLIQLKKLNHFLICRRAAAKMLKEVFNKYDDYFQLQEELPIAESSWFGFPITIKDGAPFTAKQIRAYFEANGIETRSLICGNIARQPGMKLWPHRIHGDLKHADKIMRDGFSIGCHQGIAEASCAHINSVLKGFVK
jgi:CDP-6-deoxy-D-xylo-4-hexulose-3-dehydrase